MGRIRTCPATPSGDAPVPQVFPFRTSLAGSLDGLTIGAMTLVIPAVGVVPVDDDRRAAPGREALERLMVLTSHACSSSGSELPGCPSWYLSAFRKLTAGRLPASAAIQKEERSYWWFAWSVCPIMEGELGGRWCGLDGRSEVLERLVVRAVGRLDGPSRPARRMTPQTAGDPSLGCRGRWA